MRTNTLKSKRTASVVRTSYSHGVAATAVAISANGGQVASGSSSGHVVVQPFQGAHGPTPLPGTMAAVRVSCSIVQVGRESRASICTELYCGYSANTKKWKKRSGVKEREKHTCAVFPKSLEKESRSWGVHPAKLTGQGSSHVPEPALKGSEQAGLGPSERCKCM